MDHEMFCPLCRAKLVAGADRCYETLSEHVGNPNARACLQPTVVCPNQECRAYTDGVYWDPYQGDGPYQPKSPFKLYAWIDGNPHPFQSICREVHTKVYG
jgi:hypothetical protein